MRLRHTTEFYSLFCITHHISFRNLETTSLKTSHLISIGITILDGRHPWKESIKLPSYHNRDSNNDMLGPFFGLVTRILLSITNSLVSWSLSNKLLFDLMLIQIYNGPQRLKSTTHSSPAGPNIYIYIYIQTFHTMHAHKIIPNQ